jgi:hypothetical protein
VIFILSIKGTGWNATLQKYRPDLAPPQKRSNVSIGEFLAEVKAKADGDPKTLEDYSRALRKIVSDVFKIDAGNEKFDYKTGGYQNWLDRVHAVKLRALTPDKVQVWKRAFLARAGNDALQMRSAKVSVNSFLRRARSLFVPKILKKLDIEVLRGSEVVDGDAFGKIEGILKDDRGWRARHGL